MRNTGKKLDISIINPAPYQLIPLTKIILNNFKGLLICDGVGVGKTISAGYIITYLIRKLNMPSLVICSPTLIDKWILELSTKFNIRVYPIRSIEDFDTAYNEIPNYNKTELRCYVLTKSLFTKDLVKEYNELNKIFSCIIIDEIHNFRNRNTKSYKNCYNFIGKASDYHIGLTATPINNRIDDLYNELNLLFSKFSLNTWKFTIDELTSKKEIKLLSPIMTRYTKEKLKVHFTQRQIFNEFIELSSEHIGLIKKNLEKITKSIDKKGFPLELITYFRLANSSIKAFMKSFGKKYEMKINDTKIKKLFEVINNNQENKWLIFCEFEETVNYLFDNLTQLNYSIYSITGKTPLIERNNIIQMFKNSDKGILILTSVGTEGLDMQFCSAMINYDLNWNPMILEQRIGRIDRIGQEKLNIKIYNFRIVDSIDDRIINVLEDKLKIISDIFSIENKPITSNQNENFKIDGLFQEELASANSLIESSEIISLLEYDDYTVLPEINTKYCNVDQLAKIKNFSNEIEWFAENMESQNWINDLITCSNKLKEILNYYS